jgi:hypothetical protein
MYRFQLIDEFKTKISAVKRQSIEKHDRNNSELHYEQIFFAQIGIIFNSQYVVVAQFNCCGEGSSSSSSSGSYRQNNP